MKKVIIPVVVSSLLLLVVACNGSNGGGANPPSTPQIVPNGTYKGNVTTPPASVSMLVTGLSAAITLTDRLGRPTVINGTFNANIATSSSSVTSTTCYNGLFADKTALTITNCLYVSGTNAFSGNLVLSPDSPAIPVILTSS